MHRTSIPDFAVSRGQLMRPTFAVDGAKTAVIAIDFQRFFIDDDQPMGNAHARDILDNANRLHAAVRNAGGIVVFTQHSMGARDELTSAGEAIATLPPERKGQSTLLPGSPAYDLHPALERSEQDWKVVKFQSSPLHPHSATNLDDKLRKHGIDAIIVSGLVTNGCCDCTARDAFQYGYNVTVATDATAAMTDEEHNASLLNLTLYYAHTRSVDEIIAALG
jgi:nicotinamidase-related amidase